MTIYDSFIEFIEDGVEGDAHANDLVDRQFARIAKLDGVKLGEVTCRSMPSSVAFDGTAYIEGYHHNFYSVTTVDG